MVPDTPDHSSGKEALLFADLHGPSFLLGPLHRLRTRREPSASVHQFATFEKLRFPAVGFAVKTEIAGHRRAIAEADELEEEFSATRHSRGKETARRRREGLVGHRGPFRGGSIAHCAARVTTANEI